MPQPTNHHMPKVRTQTAKLVLRDGWSMRKASRPTGFSVSTISRRAAKAKLTARNTIPAESSRPRHHPNELPQELADRIVELRKQRNRCAEVARQKLINAGYETGLSSVKRTPEGKGQAMYSGRGN